MKHPLYHWVLVFIVAFVLVYGLYGGLPYDFNADLLRDENAYAAVSYGELLSYCLNPATPALFFYGRMEQLRPFMYVLHKFFIENFGSNLEPVHFLVALAHGILALCFFLISYWVTRRKLYSWLAVLLYASFPANTFMLAGYVALEIQFLLSALILAAMTALVISTWKPLTILKRAGLFLVWIFFTWLAIKWKSSEKILPFVYLTFLVLRFEKIKERVGLKTNFLLLLINLLMFILVVPLPLRQFHPHTNSQTSLEGVEYRKFLEKEKKTRSFKFSNSFARTFRLPGAENPMTTISLDKQPTSFTGNLGFFLGWLFWLGILAVPFLGRRAKRNLAADATEAFEFRWHAMILNLLWFFAIIAGFASGQTLEDVRYLNFAFVPAITLIAFLIRLAQDGSFYAHRLQPVFALGLSLAFAFTIFQNFGFVTKWVGHFGGIQYALYESDKLIHRAFFKENPVGLSLIKKHLELEKRVLFVSWYDWKGDWFAQEQEKIKREGVLFVKTRQEDDEKLEKFRQAGYRVKKIQSFDFYDARPLFFRLSKFLIQSGLRRHKDLRVIVYQIS